MTKDKFESFFIEARESVTIIGTTPLIPHLEKSARFFADLLSVYPEFKLNILYESDTESFHQSVCFSTSYATEPTSHVFLKTHRNRISGTDENGGLLKEISNAIDERYRKQVSDRVFIRQQNLRVPFNIIRADSRVWIALPTFDRPTLDSYREIDKNDREYENLCRYVDFCLDRNAGGAFLSKPKEELIWVYNKDGLPTGIFPRSSFYTTDYGRYVIWAFVFNRRGEILLQRRSMRTKDNRGLWDKSIGGHVDLTDVSTSVTARRELVEEMFLPDAEFTKYFQADIGDIIDFGEWNTSKRPERYFTQAFQALGPADWVMFRATNRQGLPLTIRRVSNRRIHEDEEGKEIVTKQTIFHSDVYLMIAPPGQLDTSEQMKRTLKTSEEEMRVASDHRSLTVYELKKWIEESKRDGTEETTFTDDLLYIDATLGELLEEFSEFIKYIQENSAG